MPDFGIRNTLFEYFWAGILKKLLPCLKLILSKLFNCQVLCKKRKSLIWDQKCLIWVFWVTSSKSYCHIWNQHPRTCLMTTFCFKIKIPEFGIPNVLFGHFWPWALKKLLSYLTQRPRICIIARFGKRVKML